MPPRFKTRHGFTLIELLTVLSIVAVLASIIFACVNQAVTSANKTKLVSNLRATHTGLVAYLADHKNTYPGTSGNDVTGLNVGTENSWHAAISPYTGETPKSMTHWRGVTTIAQSVFHDPLDDTVTTASKRPIRNIAINGVNSVGAGVMGVVNRNINTIAYPAKLLELTTGIAAEDGDEYAGGMRVAQSYYSDATTRKRLTRVSGHYYCVFVDGHLDIIPEQTMVDEARKSANSVFFDPAASNGSGR